MSKLTQLVLNKQDFITSDKVFNFYHNSERNGSDVQYIKTDFIKYRNKFLVNINNWRNVNKTVNIETTKVLITGHSDYSISHDELDILQNSTLKMWFCQNLDIKHPKLMSIPIGITNKDEPNSLIHQIIGNTDRIFDISKTQKVIKNLVYMNFTIDTYPFERRHIYNLYKDKSWVTVGNSNISEKGHYKFLDDIYSHKFVFAPRGNGIDTHRLWETLYLRSIPIVAKCLGMEMFSDLPILFVDNWDNITEDFLNEKYIEIMDKSYPLEKLKIDYWLNLINAHIDT